MVLASAPLVLVDVVDDADGLSYTRAVAYPNPAGGDLHQAIGVLVLPVNGEATCGADVMAAAVPHRRRRGDCVNAGRRRGTRPRQGAVRPG